MLGVLEDVVVVVVPEDLTVEDLVVFREDHTLQDVVVVLEDVVVVVVPEDLVV